MLKIYVGKTWYLYLSIHVDFGWDLSLFLSIIGLSQVSFKASLTKQVNHCCTLDLCLLHVCPQFGNSGSSVMTHFTEDGESRYAFAGPLSMHKGCDQVGPGFIMLTVL